jgi:hypothetical protein
VVGPPRTSTGTSWDRLSSAQPRADKSNGLPARTPSAPSLYSCTVALACKLRMWSSSTLLLCCAQLFVLGVAAHGDLWLSTLPKCWQNCFAKTGSGCTASSCKSLSLNQVIAAPTDFCRHLHNLWKQHVLLAQRRDLRSLQMWRRRMGARSGSRISRSAVLRHAMPHPKRRHDRSLRSGRRRRPTPTAYAQACDLDEQRTKRAQIVKGRQRCAASDQHHSLDLHEDDDG